MTKQSKRYDVPHVVFRADADWKTGGGHVRRCLSLAEQLAAAGWKCSFACRKGVVETVPALAASGYDLLILEGPEASEADGLLQRWPAGVDWLVVDHYRRDARFERACRSWADSILVIDDLADRPHDCDVLLDQSPGRTADDYRRLVPKETEVLVGPDFALMRSQFAKRRDEALARRRKGGEAARILVSVGAADAYGLTVAILRGLAQADPKVAIDVVVGAAWPNLDAVRECAEALPHDVTIHQDVDDMAALMAAADLAIGCGGSTTWERCCLGLPTLVIMSASNQQAIAMDLDRLGAIKFIGAYCNVGPSMVASVASKILHDGSALQAMAKKAAAVCDGNGAGRLVERMKAKAAHLA